MKIQDCLRNKSSHSVSPGGRAAQGRPTLATHTRAAFRLRSASPERRWQGWRGPSPWLSLGPPDPKTWPSPRPSLSTRLPGSLTHRPGCRSQPPPRHAPWALGARGPPHGLPRPAGERRAHLSSLAKRPPHLSENHSGRQGKGGTFTPHLLLLLSVFLALFF